MGTSWCSYDEGNVKVHSHSPVWSVGGRYPGPSQYTSPLSPDDSVPVNISGGEIQDQKMTVLSCFCFNWALRKNGLCFNCLPRQDFLSNRAAWGREGICSCKPGNLGYKPHIKFVVLSMVNM